MNHYDCAAGNAGSCILQTVQHFPERLHELSPASHDREEKHAGSKK